MVEPAIPIRRKLIRWQPFDATDSLIPSFLCLTAPTLISYHRRYFLVMRDVWGGPKLGFGVKRNRDAEYQVIFESGLRRRKFEGR